MAMLRKALRIKRYVGLFLVLVLVLGYFYSFGKSNALVDLNTGTIKMQTRREQAEIGMPREEGTPFLIPSDNVLENLSESEQLTIYWKYINTVQVLCRNQTRVGSMGDGGKEMCVDIPYKPSKPCIVYSFGSNFQFDFDIAMKRFYGCEVFTYDPSIAIQNRNIPMEVKFELRGLDEKDWTNEKKWRMSTLQTIMKDNKHENNVIDVLKIDIEGGEWKSLPPFLETGRHRQVKQLLLETHAGRMGPSMDKDWWGGVNLAGQLRVLRLLYEAGFRIFMREHNMFTLTKFPVPPQTVITITNEISLVNVNFVQPLG